MLRRLIGRIFGFTRELEELRQRVRELSWDETFGMWTRGAFLQFCQVMPRSRRAVVFLDLSEVHALNERLGYKEVNRRVKVMFSIPFRRSDIVARWYSGDEIVILFDGDRAGAERKIAQLQWAAEDQGIAFQHAIGEWEVGRRSIETVIDELAAQVTALKIRAEGPGSDRPTSRIV